MNKQELINEITALNLISNHDADRIVTVAFEKIETALARGEDVRITGFGVFKRITTKARTGRNPRTGEAVEIPERNRVKFKASSTLKV